MKLLYIAVFGYHSIWMGIIDDCIPHLYKLFSIHLEWSTWMNEQFYIRIWSIKGPNRLLSKSNILDLQ